MPAAWLDPASYAPPAPRRVVQTEREIVILYVEANGNVRRDSHRRPAAAEQQIPHPGGTGIPIGHWDGETLVVETTGFRDDVWLDVEGSPLTSSGKMTERWRRVKYGLMQIDITIEDPKAYTKPFTVRVNHQLMPDTELMEFVCQRRRSSHCLGKDAKK